MQETSYQTRTKESALDSLSAKILIVDDVPANLKILRDALRPEGYNILVAGSGEDALRTMSRSTPDFLTARDDNDGLVEGFMSGGVDYITKPFEKEEVLARIQTHLKISRLTRAVIQKNNELTEALNRLQEETNRREAVEDALYTADAALETISHLEAERWGISGFIGQSGTMERIIEDVCHLHHAPSTSVLITGESGTGKELIARAIHFDSSRSTGPFVPVNCSAIPAELAESLFFGHVKGAFTGAQANRKGYFEQAAGGTLFLDEIGDMPLNLQAKLLRTLEDGRITPVGGSIEKQIDTRIVAATNANIQSKISMGEFRNDLYFRIAGFMISLPPLRERREDIPLLAEHFLKVFATEMRRESAVLSEAALSALMDYPFPGNVRELKNVIENALIRSGDGVIMPEHFHFLDIGAGPLSMPYEQNPASAYDTAPPSPDAEQIMLARTQSEDEQRILEYLRANESVDNNECRRILGINKRRATYLLNKMQQYGLLERRGENRWCRYRLRAVNV